MRPSESYCNLPTTPNIALGMVSTAKLCHHARWPAQGDVSWMIICYIENYLQHIPLRFYSFLEQSVVSFVCLHTSKQSLGQQSADKCRTEPALLQLCLCFKQNTSTASYKPAIISGDKPNLSGESTACQLNPEVKSIFTQSRKLHAQ